MIPNLLSRYGEHDEGNERKKKTFLNFDFRGDAGVTDSPSLMRPLNHDTVQFKIDFCTCSRFSASSKIVCALASKVSSSISLPR